MWSLSSQSIGASVGSTENTASSIVACCTVFIELLPDNALIKSATVFFLPRSISSLSDQFFQLLNCPTNKGSNNILTITLRIVVKVRRLTRHHIIANCVHYTVLDCILSTVSFTRASGAVRTWTQIFSQPGNVHVIKTGWHIIKCRKFLVSLSKYTKPSADIQKFPLLRSPSQKFSFLIW
jgi:hypothetical protein